MNGLTLETLPDFPSRHLGNRRTIDVVLPAGYADGDGPFPLLLLHDGQDLAALRVLPTLAALFAGNAVRPFIVAAIPTNGERMREYGVARAADSAGRGDKAQAYSDFVRLEVLPALRARYRIATGPADTAILGASLGGLSAFDLAWNYPDIFGIGGAFSGSFWWRTDSSSLAAKTATRIAHRMVREDARAQDGQRFWFQAGTDDETADRDGNGVIDAIQDTTELMEEMARKGWRREVDMTYVEIPGGRHHPETWAKVFGDFVRFAFRAVPAH